MHRFKLVFNNSGSASGVSLYNNSSQPIISRGVSVSRNLPLNAPMIDRVHKAKPGCSACGKKVA